MRLYQVTLTDINEKSEMSLILFLCSYADHPVFTTIRRRTTCICTCTPPVLASLIFLFMEAELECNITYRKL